MSEEWNRIKKALENPNYRWRTVGGIAEECGLEHGRIAAALHEHGDEVIKSSIPSNTGEDLFTTRRHYRRSASPFRKIMSSIKGRVE